MMELDREDFRLWLAAKEPDDYAGEAHRSLGCPLSVYLWERHDMRRTVSSLGLDVGHGPTEDRDIPRWTRRFVVQLDTAIKAGEVATAKDALTILDSIEVSS